MLLAPSTGGSPGSTNAAPVRLALRLIAVGILVLASLWYAGSVQIGVRSTEIASFKGGRSAVRLVERLNDVSTALAAYRPTRDPAAGRAQLDNFRAALARADHDLRANALHGNVPHNQITPLLHPWSALGTRPPSPALLRSTREALRDAYIRIGSNSEMRGTTANADRLLGEESLLFLPGANAQFERLASMLSAAAYEQVSTPFTRAALASIYADARSATNVALDASTLRDLPPEARAQADAARAATGVFFDLLGIHVARGDALAQRAILLQPAAEASERLQRLEAMLLPLLDARLVQAQNRAQREIAAIVGLIAATILVFVLLSFQVMRSHLRARHSREAFEHQALHDALTGLPNRRAFTQAAAKAVSEWTAINDRTQWVLSIDFDYFKEVNDRYGHQAGDEFLIAAAKRLRAAVPPDDVVARVGGDEFAVLVHQFDPDSSHALQVGEAICAAFIEPIRVEGLEHRLAASVGVVALDALHDTVDSILRDADIAMYRAKEDGGDRAVEFDDALRATIIDRAEARRRPARRARARHRTARRVPADPLARGSHVPRLRSAGALEASGARRDRRGTAGRRRTGSPPDRAAGAARPARSLPPPRGLACRRSPARWALDPLQHLADGSRARRHLRLDRRSDGDLEHPAANAGDRDDRNGVDRFDRHRRPFSGRLCTRSACACASTISAPATRRCATSTTFSVDAIKIDRSFVVSAANDAAKVPIVAGIIALARGLNAEVIAEGIETIEQRDLIRDLGCGLVQGYLFARPLPADEAFRFAQATRAPIARGA